MTEGEAFVYSGGGVGVFGEIGVPEAAMKEKKWTRIVITLGPLQSAPAVQRNRAGMPGFSRRPAEGMMVDENDDELEEVPSYSQYR